MKRVRGRVTRFEGEIHGILEKQASLQEQINQCIDELDMLYEEVRDAYDREERRQEEFVVEREISPVSYREMIMPWSKEAESERRFRRAVLAALLLCFVFGASHSPDKNADTGHLGRCGRDSETIGQACQEGSANACTGGKTGVETGQSRAETGERKAETAERKAQTPAMGQKTNKQPKGGGPAMKAVKKVAIGGGGGVLAARKKAEHVGVLAFSDAFKDLMKETPVAKLGTEARLSNKSRRVAGRAVSQRSLVTKQALDGSSGGIGNADSQPQYRKRQCRPTGFRYRYRQWQAR